VSWLWLGIYVIGWLFGYRLAYRFLASDATMGPSDHFDRVFLSAIAAGMGLLWPLGIPVALLHRFARPVTQQEREQLLREREADLNERETHIRQLERDLGIGGNQ